MLASGANFSSIGLTVCTGAFSKEKLTFPELQNNSSQKPTNGLT